MNHIEMAIFSFFTRYVAYLKENAASSGAAPSSSGGGAAAAGGDGGGGGNAAPKSKRPNGVEIAKRVLELGEEGGYEAILNLSGGGKD